MIALDVWISTVISTIEKGLQCPCFIRKRSNFSDPSVRWFGLLTLARYAIDSSGVISPTGCVTDTNFGVCIRCLCVENGGGDAVFISLLG